MVRTGILGLALAACGTLVLVVACGTDASGIDGCRQIETARCQRAASCGVDLSGIAYVGSSASDAIDGCVRYYHEACLHGLVVTDPGGTKIQACVKAVNTGTCDVVKAPETAADCAWLIPPVVDAGSDADADALDDAADSSDAAAD